MKKILLFCISFMFATFFLIGCENKEINETPSSSQYEEQSSEAIKINKSFNIEESQVSEILSQEYTGSEIVVPIEVVLNNEILLEDADYELNYENNVEVGTAKIIVIGKGIYSGKKILTFQIVNNNEVVDASKLEQSRAYIKCQNKTYNGETQTIATCKNGTISGADKKEVGKYTIQCKGNKNYDDALPIECSIYALSISEATISKIEDQVYTGKAITPMPTVKIGDKVLVKDKDYTLDYNKNINIGTSTLTIYGKGNYKGGNRTTFQIVEDESSNQPEKEIAIRGVSFKELSKVISVNESITLSPYIKPETATNKNLTWSSSDNSIATVSSSGRVIGRKEGKVTITAVAKVKSSSVTDEKVVSTYDLYVCGTPIKLGGEINNNCFNINSNNSDNSVAEQNSKGITAAVNYSLENKKTNINLKGGKYYFKAIKFSNSSAQNYPYALFIANNDNSNLNLNLGNSTLVLLENNYTRGSLIYIGEISNVTISNGILIGDSKTHKCSDGTTWVENDPCAESYHGVYVHGAKNVKLDNLKISDFVGDGVYIYGDSENISVVNSDMHDFGRNSVTATYGVKINVKNNIFYNNDWGVKVEPTSTQYQSDQYPVKDLIVDGNLIYGSRYHGSVYLFRSKNVVVKNNRLGDIISSSYCGETRDETDYSQRCFAGNEKEEVKVSGNTVYFVPNNTTTTPEIVNINCIDGAKGCISSFPWRKVNGNWYYINTSNGTLTKNKWILGTGTGDKKDKWYYVGSNGIRYIDKTAIIDGESYKFDANGVCIQGGICN